MRVRSRPDGFAAAVICAPTTAVLLALSTLVVPGPAQADPAPEPTPSPGPAVGDYGPPPVTFNPGNLPGAVDLQPPAAPPSVIDFQPPTVQQPKVWEGGCGWNAHGILYYPSADKPFSLADVCQCDEGYVPTPSRGDWGGCEPDASGLALQPPPTVQLNPRPVPGPVVPEPLPVERQ